LQPLEGGLADGQGTGEMGVRNDLQDRVPIYLSNIQNTAPIFIIFTGKILNKQ
jgi:hypothetical protein